MKDRVRQIMSLTAADGWSLFEAWVLILVTDLVLWFGPRAKLQRMMSGSDVSSEASPDALARGRRLARLVDLAAALHPRRVRCLTRALALRYLLKRRGWSARLRFGVRMEGGQVESGQLRAHAWLELGGEPLGESAGVEHRFKPLVSLSS